MSAIRVDSAKPYFATSSLVIGYALCSSLLAVINKFAITKFNYPVWGLGKSGFLPHDPFTWQTAKTFLPAALVFYLAIFINTNLLRHANVDTFVVFRSCTPLLVALADTAFRKQPIPDWGFSSTAYSWAFADLVTIATKMVYIKHMFTNVGLNAWGFVLYNNDL
ncbi:GDP-mannose transporter GONST4 [Pyrus ussuriensis x Pyrus communis]|uniref:GDP-mannose transporter GONST4 n=1 Tax=Pyrus ussuriensis x Pyrus communis TaxID=2448454 RepID=A0A5N5HAI6_9ROSA|nr:GDP-mannose transporter GONST4 [Pyrus ussuriensis x Pyrus communis]